MLRDVHQPLPPPLLAAECASVPRGRTGSLFSRRCPGWVASCHGCAESDGATPRPLQPAPRQYPALRQDLGCACSRPASVRPGPTERPLYVAHRPVEDARATLGFLRIHSITYGCRTAWGLFLRKRYPPGYLSYPLYLAATACPASRRYTSLRSSDSIQGEDSPPCTHRLRPSQKARSRRACTQEHPAGAVLKMAASCSHSLLSGPLSPSQV